MFLISVLCFQSVCCVSDKCIVSDKFVALSLSVLCFEESVLCYQCVCAFFALMGHHKFMIGK